MIIYFSKGFEIYIIDIYRSIPNIRRLVNSLPEFCYERTLHHRSLLGNGFDIKEETKPMHQ